MRAACAAGLVAMLTLRAWGADRPIAILFPLAGVTTAPADLALQIRVIPDARNRGVDVFWDGGPRAEAGRTWIALEGDEAPRIVPREPRWLHIATPGVYDITAALVTADGRARHRSVVRVYVRGVPDDER